MWSPQLHPSKFLTHETEQHKMVNYCILGYLFCKNKQISLSFFSIVNVLYWMCAQLYHSLCGPMDCSPSGSSVHGIFQTRILEWGAIFILQGILLTQGSKLSLLCILHWQEDSLPLAPPGKLLIGLSLSIHWPFKIQTLLLVQRIKVKVKISQSCLTLCDRMHPWGPWNSPSQNTRVGSCSLLQIFPIQRLNPGLSYCRQILYQLSHQGSPEILE